MNDRTYLIPGLIGWTFKTSAYGLGLWSPNGGPGITVTAEMPAAEIAERVKGLIWFNFKVPREVSEAAAKSVLMIDWQTMIQEAGQDVQHQSPALPGWTLKISDLGSGIWYSNGSGVQLTADTSQEEIAAGVRATLQYSLTAEEIQAQVEEFQRIDFKSLILNAWAPQPAPLLEGFTADNSALVKTICADIQLLSLMQKSNDQRLVNEICVLIRKI